MSAPVYQSTQNSGWATTTSSVVTKPSGVAVGDLLVLYWAYEVDASPNAPGGWTAIRTTTNSLSCSLYYRVADSSDVSASNYTFTSVNSRKQIAVITRITGQGTGNFFSDTGGTTNNTATPSVAGLTPVNRADSNLILQYWQATTSTTAVGSYAITTDNPSWTEAFDVADSTTNNISMAYATRSQQTATGNVSCAGGAGTTDWVGQVVAIAPNWSTTTTESVSLIETKKLSFVMSKNETVTLTENVDADESRLWINDDKPSSTWNNTEPK